MDGNELGRLGVWEQRTAGWLREPDTMRELVDLGFGALWLGASPPADLKFPEELLARSSRLVVATGIVNVWEASPGETAASFRRIGSDRFLLGVGAGHPHAVGDAYVRPYDKLVGYLDTLDAGGVPKQARALAALGPRVLRLAAERTAGAHPYLVTPEHTARAREILGTGPLLAPEQKVVLETDPAVARRIARERLGPYLSMVNYANNWRRLGFTDDDLAGGGSDRLVDALIVWGDEEAIRSRVAQHHAAGADHVALQVLNRDKPATLRRLAPALV
ncbi:MAG TPA: LLM class F420-dependent oxidoreductase [Actinophytocola sp.]|jgi:probable F420-dependent oxidoreductase|uniref:LLM class F420-dependent oxidoreductase n=1 Tax=Actinophytocola sp. TaxID=1872138 RepID=UPI002F94BC12